MNLGSPSLLDWVEYYRQHSTSSKNERVSDFYRHGVINPATSIGQAPMVAMDFETTGLSSADSEIVSIGLVPFDLKRIYCGESRHWIVKPEQDMTEDSIVIHGITHSNVDAAPPLANILDQVLDAIEGKLVVVHYRYIEREFFNKAVLGLLQEPLLFPLIDTMEIESDILKGRQGFFDKILRKPLKPIRLDYCRRRYNLPHYDAHNALTDAIATAELLQAQIAHHLNPDMPVKDLWA
ncbi:3'-5' exonuclease [Amphritea sp.]|uniref:3'-5' exonuclease n=1 Tax=Amphritea sp. TaxID=1872502 RepID=UPI0025B816CC|nr:3'-5' exonuclease [Amphritea sp.]